MSPLNKWYCPGLNNSLWWCSKLNIKKWNAILYKTNTYIFALRKTTTELTVNNIFISILFDFRIWIIQHGTVAMSISAHGSFGIEWHVFLIENTFFYLLMSEWSKHCLALTSAVTRFGGGTTQFHWIFFQLHVPPLCDFRLSFFSCAGEFQQINEVVVLSVV